MGLVNRPFYVLRSNSPLTKAYFTLFILLLILLFGVSGYVFIEDLSFIDALYMTIITVSTVGFGEVKELSGEGRLFTSFLIVSSFGTFAYAVSVLTKFIVSGEFQQYFKDIRVNKDIQKLNGHTIICGYGRNGQRAVDELLGHKKDFVIIDSDSELVAELRKEHALLFVEGDAKQDHVLIEAGIDRAKAMITTMPDDADNLYIVLTARGLNKGLVIVSRASTDSAEDKLKMAGADHVIMPYKIGGGYMASLVVKPDVVEFMNHIITQNADPSNIEEILCDQLTNDYDNITLGDLAGKIGPGATIIGFKNIEGSYIINPSSKTKLEKGCKLFVLGTKEQMKAFE